MENKLLPCQFCGEYLQPKKTRVGIGMDVRRCQLEFITHHNDCFLKNSLTVSVYMHELDEYIKKWNTRTNKDAQVLAELKEWAKQYDADNMAIEPYVLLDKIKELQGECECNLKDEGSHSVGCIECQRE